MPRKHRMGPYFAWRLPHPDEPPTFEIMVGRSWLLSIVGFGLAVCGLLLALPPARRMRTLGASIMTGAALAVVVLLEGLRSAAFPVLRHLDLPLPNLPPSLDGLRIAQLSDFHLGMPLARGASRRAVAAVQALQPDVIALTGDFLSYRRSLHLVREALQPLSAPYGVFAVWGNHDHWEGIEPLADLLRDLGVIVLFNEHRMIEVDDGRLVIAGVDDQWDGNPDLAAALAGVPQGAPIILLAHSPDYADIAALSPVAVQLAGHTHGGHISLPGLGPLVLPRHGVRYGRDLHRVGNMWLHVSHGLGGIPIRLGSRAEATMLTLRALPSPSNDVGAT